MAKKGGSGKYDVMLEVGVNVDGKQVEAELSKALQNGLKRGGPVEKAAKGYGTNFAKSAFGGATAEQIRKEVSEVEKELKRASDNLKTFMKTGKLGVNKDGKVDGRGQQTWLDSYKAIISGHIGTESQVKALERHLKTRLTDLQKLEKLSVKISQAGGVKTVALRRAAGMSDEALLGLNPKKKALMQRELADYKKYIDTLKKLRESAEANQDVRGAKRIGSLLSTMESGLGGYARVTDFKAAQRRVDAERKKNADLDAKSRQKAAEDRVKAQQAEQRNALADQKRLGAQWAKDIEAVKDLSDKGQRAADWAREKARRDHGKRLIASRAREQIAQAKEARRVAAGDADFLRRTSVGRGVIDQFGGLGNLNAKGMSFDQAQLAKKAAMQGEKYYGAAAKRQEAAGVSNTANVAKMEQYAAAVRNLDAAHKKLNPTLSQSTILLRNFLRFAVGYQALYQALAAVTALTQGVIELDKNLANIKAITASTSKEMQLIAGAINDVAVKTKFSTNEIAEAAKILSQAGTAAEDLPRVLKSVADFAAATDSSLNTAADTVSTMKEVFADLNDQQIADQLTKAVNLSKLSGEDLQTILSLGAQVAEGYNVTSEQFLSAVSVLRNAGIKASTVATGMRQAMLEIFNPDDPTLKALQYQYAQLGETLSGEEIRAKFYNFTNELDPLLSAMTELKRLGFGAEGDFGLTRGIDVRAVNVMKELVKSSEQYLQMQAEFNYGQPAIEGSITAMDSLSASVDNLGSALTALAAQESTGFVSMLKEAVKYSTELVENIRQYNLEKAAGSLSVGKRTFGGAIEAGISAVFPGLGALRSAGSLMESTRTTEERGAATALLAKQAEDALAAERTKRAAYDPANPEAKSIGGSLRAAAAIKESFSAEFTALFAEGARETAIDLLVEYRKVMNDKTIQHKGQYLEPIIEQLKQLSTEADKVNSASVTQLVADTEQIRAYNAGFIENFRKLYETLQDAARNGDESAKESLAAIERSGVDYTGLLYGTADSVEVADTFTKLLEIHRDVLSPDGKVAELEKAQFDALKAAMEAEFDLAEQSDDVEGMLALSIQGYLASISSLGAEAARRKLDSMKTIVAERFGIASPQYQALATRGEAGVTAKAEAERLAILEQGKPRTQNNAIPAATPKEYMADPSRMAAANALDFEISKLQKFGDATGKLAGLVQQKNDILMQEKSKEISILQANAKLAEHTDDYTKELAKVNDAQLELQKLELQNKEEYLDSIAKMAERELKGYGVKTDTLLAAGDFKGLAALSEQYKAAQGQNRSSMTAAMKAMGMSDADIADALESNQYLNDGLLKDKDVNQIFKRQGTALKASQSLMPKSATTGDSAMDARARAGLGFTDAETMQYLLAQIEGSKGQKGVLEQQIAELELAKMSASKEQAEQMNDQITTYKDNIVDLDLAIQDLTVATEDMHKTAGEELASVFNAEGARAFTTALQQSGNVLKDWGENIRSNLLTAWEAVGDAIADAIIEGKSFKDSMKEIVKTLANDVLRMTTKNLMNNLMVGMLGGDKPSSGAGGKDASGLVGAAISMLGSLFGGGGGAASAATSAGGSSLNLGLDKIRFRYGGVIPNHMKFAKGYVRRSGLLGGPGSGTSDSLRGVLANQSGISPIAVSSGESILTADATSMLGESTINALNNGTSAAISTGGLAANSRANSAAADLKQLAPSVTVMPPPPQAITVVNTIDSGSVFQQGAKAPGSSKVLLNEVRANKSAFQRALS